MPITKRNISKFERRGQAGLKGVLKFKSIRVKFRTKEFCLLPQTIKKHNLLHRLLILFLFSYCSESEMTKSSSPLHINSKSAEMSSYPTIGSSMNSHISPSLSPLYTTVAIPNKPQSLNHQPPAYGSIYTSTSTTKDLSSLASSRVVVN